MATHLAPLHLAGLACPIDRWSTSVCVLFAGVLGEGEGGAIGAGSGIDHRKSTLARGSRWDYTPLPFIGGNSYLSWCYGRGAIRDQARKGTSKGLSQAIKRGPIRKFLPKYMYANVYVTIQGRGFSAGAWTHYVTVNGFRNGLGLVVIRTWRSLD